MGKLSLYVYLNAYEDRYPSNNASQNNFKWNRDISSIFVDNPNSISTNVAPGETLSLFSGVRTLSQDDTTEYSISLLPLSTNTYVLSNVGGTAPNFRTPRTTGADSTSQITVTINGPVATFSSSGGTYLNLSGSQVGDYVTIGNNFNVLNQGTYQIIALGVSSFSINNPNAVAEGPITLGSNFATQIAIFSAAGVQINDTLVISGGFSLVTQGSYKVTAVYANSLEFYFNGVLPQEGPITTEDISVYSSSKSLIYLESNSSLNVICNGQNVGNILPFIINNANQPSLPPTIVPGIFMFKSTIYSLSVENNGINNANLFFAAVE